MDIPDAKRLRALEEDNAKLNKLLAETMLDKEALQVALRKKVLPPHDRRAAVTEMLSQTAVSERKACSLVGITRSSINYHSILPVRDHTLTGRIVELAQERRRFGYINDIYALIRGMRYTML
jgi:putative transposase